MGVSLLLLRVCSPRLRASAVAFSPASRSRRDNRADHPVALPEGVVQLPGQAGAVVAVGGLVVVDVDALGLLRVEAYAEDELALGGELGGLGEFQGHPAGVAAEE